MSRYDNLTILLVPKRATYLGHPLCQFKVTAGEYECMVGLDEIRPFLPREKWEEYKPQYPDYGAALKLGTDRIAKSAAVQKMLDAMAETEGERE